MTRIVLLFAALLLLASCTSRREKAVEYNQNGIRLMYQSRIDDAIAEFEKAIKADPEFEQPYYYRGNLRFGKGDVESALSDYNKAIELNPGFADAYANRGDLYASINRRDKACPDWIKALELGKKNFEDRIRGCR